MLSYGWRNTFIPQLTTRLDEHRGIKTFEGTNATIIILGAYFSHELSLLKTISINNTIGDKHTTNTLKVQ